MLIRPVFVIATQDGLDQTGISALPESQLDRFLMCLSLGFPEQETEQGVEAHSRRVLKQVDGLR